MKASVGPETEIRSLPEGIESVHLVRPIGKKRAASLLRARPGIEKVTLSPSCLKRVSPSLKEFLEKKGIGIAVVNERGRAIAIPLEKMLKAIEMRKDFRPLREIEELTGIPKSTIHYLVRHSSKKKVKKGKNVIYLE